MDLSKIGTIHAFVQSLVDDGITIDICILNAAVALARSAENRNRSG